jgi:hypothetical protein
MPLSVLFFGGLFEFFCLVVLLEQCVLAVVWHLGAMVGFDDECLSWSCFLFLSLTLTLSMLCVDRGNNSVHLVWYGCWQWLQWGCTRLPYGKYVDVDQLVGMHRPTCTLFIHSCILSFFLFSFFFLFPSPSVAFFSLCVVVCHLNHVANHKQSLV